MRSKILHLLLAGFLATAVLAGCGDDEETTSSTTTAPDDSSSTTEGSPVAELDLVKDGTITACSDTPYEPFEMEGDDGEQTGYDMEIMRGIAEANDLEFAVLDVPFDGILGNIAAGKCDVIVSAVTVTPERAEQVDFSDGYFDSDQSLLIRKEDAEKYKSLDDLAGKTIAVQSTTTGEAYAKAHTPSGATIQSFEDADGMFGAITAKQVEAVLQDFPVNYYRSQQDDAFVVTEKFETGEVYGFGVAKGNTALLDLLNKGIKDLYDDGTIDELFAKYFPDE